MQRLHAEQYKCLCKERAWLRRSHITEAACIHWSLEEEVYHLNHQNLVEGLVLINIDPCAKGWMDWAASKLSGWTTNLDDIVLAHHFSSEELETNLELIQTYRLHISQDINQENLHLFVNSYNSRRDLEIERPILGVNETTVKTLQCPALLVVGDTSPAVEAVVVVGGLLSAHILSKEGGIQVEPGWPCSGPLLRLAEEAARRLLPAFQTSTGMPYGTVNLMNGVNPTETPVTCTAGIGTFILEFATLSHLTGDPVFEEVARKALDALWNSRSDIGLVGNHIDVETSKWVAQDAGIGAGIDSYFEYLVKGAILLQDEKLMSSFLDYEKVIKNYTKFDDWYVWVQMYKGTVSMPVFQSLDAFWPGLQSLIGDINNAMKTFHNYYQVWKQYGGLPEFYSIPQGSTVDKREGYPLRPELVESAMYLYRATGDPTLLEMGRDVIEAIEKISRVDCGFATVRDLRDHKLDNRMESFFLAETVKYLYLLFDPDNFLHNDGSTFRTVTTPYGECILGAGGYLFNTEAHPIDPAALHCCSQHKEERWEVEGLMQDFRATHYARMGLHAAGASDQTPQYNQKIRATHGGKNTNKRRNNKRIPMLSCPHQHFSWKLAVLGQVFADSS
ncbi:ER degradation-enhancing alpha-mannosidase-like protein 2 [Rhincodon typus]|uniref:ER degradation-enhancing alpha-mannosidase-like protein 2 n=1 Tax=Rhincodon typus TaxID=259920 RepID=UPI00202EA5EF|nr:ER degradation-enhancing alpha-mannosidase-like protein 2 [Rhincodon typus]